MSKKRKAPRPKPKFVPPAAVKMEALAGSVMDTDRTVQELLRDARSTHEYAEATAANVNAFRCALRDSRDALEAVLASKRLRKRDAEKASTALRNVKLVLIDREPPSYAGRIG